MKIYPPCTDCGVGLVAPKTPIPEGMRRHEGRGLCSTCHRRGRTATERQTDNRASWVRKPEPWTADALCARTDPEIFYPHPGQPTVTAHAKRLCSVCPVAAECLASALEHDEPYGVWGGLTPAERYDLKHNRRRSLR